MDIIRIIKYFENEYSSWIFKDGGRKMLNRLALFIKKLNNIERRKFYDFIINQISNEKEYYSLSSCLVEEINDIELTDRFFNIYNSKKDIIDKHRKYEMIMSLLKLRYFKGKDIYSDYVENHYLKEPKNSFHLIVLYTLINENNGINLLVDYYSKHYKFIELPPDIISSKEMFLFSTFKKETDILKNLLLELKNLNKVVYIQLKSVLLGCLNSGFNKDIGKNEYTIISNILS